jgi:hypothetical protein
MLNNPEFIRKMAEGYEEMGAINLALAEEALEADNKQLEMYEKKL